MKDHRVLSGMRPTGQLHLGHYHGVLKNWARLQNEYDSYYFVADWHAFTTHYSDRIDLDKNVSDMIVDWLATGLNPNTATLFISLIILDPFYNSCYTLTCANTHRS